jgi:hypothetical protein
VYNTSQYYIEIFLGHQPISDQWNRLFTLLSLNKSVFIIALDRLLSSLHKWSGQLTLAAHVFFFLHSVKIQLIYQNVIFYRIEKTGLGFQDSLCVCLDTDSATMECVVILFSLIVPWKSWIQPLVAALNCLFSSSSSRKIHSTNYCCHHS